MPFDATKEISLVDLSPQVDLESVVRERNANQPNGVFIRLGRIANILRYYRTWQLARRAWQQACPAFFMRTRRVPISNRPVVLRDGALDRFRQVISTHSLLSCAQIETLYNNLVEGRLTLLNATHELGMPIDWNCQTAPRPVHLWRFQLHYQEYLLDLAIGAKQADRDVWPLIWQTIESWIDHNPRTGASRDDDAWHAYCISRRLPVWAQLFSLGPPSDTLRDKVLHRFKLQAEVLSRSLEFDLGGNHLLENLHALALAGCLIAEPDSKPWLDLVEKHLPKQLEAQILAHGEHFEQAPMYHCQVLGNLLQIAIVAERVRDNLADVCHSYASRMLEFLQQIIHPDGEIPLFGDSCFGEAHPVSKIAALAKLANLKTPTPRTIGATVVGPYWTWHQANNAIIFDAGPVGARSLPAHAHCDLLGFEASVDGQRWLVDSGLYDYDDSTMRAYCRSSVAHNVVTVDNEDCCDVWSKFRMGRRAVPTRFDHGQQGNYAWCCGSHNGYHHLGVPQLSRLMVAHSNGTWFCIEHASHQNENTLIGRLHLAPDLQIQTAGPHSLELTNQNTRRWLTFTPDTKLGILAGWYCDQFGKRCPTQVIVYRQKKAPTFGWALTCAPPEGTAVTVSNDCSSKVSLSAGQSDIFNWRFSTTGS